MPTTNQMVLPVLQHIADGQEHRRLHIINMLAQRFSLTEDERNRLSKSGQMEVSLSKKGFIEKTKTAHYRITVHGLEFLNQNSEETLAPDGDLETEVNPLVSNSDENLEIGADNGHPEKSIEENYQKIQEGLAAELLQKIKDNTPAFFEKLVVDLLVKMGYGGSREDAGEAVGGSGDGGIDGIINEDRLGLDVVYIQAKRWEGNVSRPEIQRFAGALQGQRARKGVFITTSNFTRDAKEYVDTIDSKIVLIDGNQLAQFMIDHNVGVSIERTYEIKRVDSDYFAENVE